LGFFRSEFHDGIAMPLKSTICFFSFHLFFALFTRVLDPDLDPDPYWILIQSGQWIRIWIRIRNPDLDPDPGGQK
jgi:hypothetical protein